MISESQNEIHVCLCWEHVSDLTFDHLTEAYPGYVFNRNPLFDEWDCATEGCENASLYRYCGVKVPDTVGNLSKVKNIVNKELFEEASMILQSYEAVEGLAILLYNKLRVFNHDTGNVSAIRTFRTISRVILESLGIESTARLTNKQVRQIMKLLSFTPEDNQ